MTAPIQRRRIRDYFRRQGGSFAAGLFFLVLTQAGGLSLPKLLQLATDAMIGGAIDEAQRWAVMLLGIAVVTSGVRIASRLFIFNAGRNVEYAIRNDLFAKLAQLPPSFFSGMPTGQVMSRAINDLTQVRLLLGPGLLNLTNTALVYLVVVPLLFLTDPTLALLTLMPLPLLGVGGRLIGRRMFEDSKEAQERLGGLSSKVQENLSAVAMIRAYGREGAEVDRFGELNRRYLEINMRLARLRGLMFPLMGLLGATGTVFLLWIGGQRIMRGELTVGEFVEFSAYLGALTWPTIALGWMLTLYQRGLAGMERINDIFGAIPSITGGPAARPLPTGRIEIRDLHFRYHSDSAPALNGISTSFAPGETVVVVGKTGAGKSTLLKAIARLIEIPPQTVWIDGVDLTELPLEQARQRVAYAPQDAFLFSRSIFENIAFGKPEASEAEVQRAAARANLSPDLAGFSEGLDTVVGERGITLSGGQRQRAALARALLLDRPVLLLDDTLSAVDTETERKILGELALRSRERTTILVTHRLACAAYADRVLVMDHGAIVEQGTEAELLAKGGVYAEMHRRQRLREALEAETHSAPAPPAEVAPVGGPK